MNLDGLVLGSIAAAAIVGIFYYALGILSTMRRGNLERSWKYLSVGAVFALVAVIVILVMDLGGNDLTGVTVNFLVNDLSPALSALATIFFLFGFRSHYLAWHPKGLEESKRADLVEMKPQSS